MTMDVKHFGICMLCVATSFVSGCQLNQLQATDKPGQLGGMTNNQSMSPSSKSVQVKLTTLNNEDDARNAAQDDIQEDRQVSAKLTMNSNDSNKLEALSAVSFNGDSIKASVTSHGCTSSADFLAEHEVIDGRCQVIIRRTKPDLCRRAPFVADIEIQFSLPADCADIPLNIANPMLVTATDGNLMKQFKK